MIAGASDKFGPLGTAGPNLAGPAVDPVHGRRVAVATEASHLPRPLGNGVRLLGSDSRETNLVAGDLAWIPYYEKM